MTLFQEIQAKCTPEQIAEGNFHVIAAAVSNGRVSLRPRLISERGVRGALGPVVGSKFIRLLSDLKDAAVADIVPAWLSGVLNAMKVPVLDHIYYLETLGCGYDWLRTDAGLDLGDASVRGLLDLIAAGNPEIAEGAVALKGLASQPATVSWQECAAAVELGA
jgi:hypothetical protein